MDSLRAIRFATFRCVKSGIAGCFLKRLWRTRLSPVVRLARGKSMKSSKYLLVLLSMWITTSALTDAGAQCNLVRESNFPHNERPRPPSWWKFVFSISMPEKFLSQLPYNERSQSDQGLGIPPQAAFNSVTCFRSFHPSIRRMWI
jgi:hypothetical protein